MIYAILKALKNSLTALIGLVINANYRKIDRLARKNVTVERRHERALRAVYAAKVRATAKVDIATDSAVKNLGNLRGLLD